MSEKFLFLSFNFLQNNYIPSTKYCLKKDQGRKIFLHSQVLILKAKQEILLPKERHGYLSLIFTVTKHKSHYSKEKVYAQCNSSVVNITNGNTRRTRLHTLSLIHKGINIMMKFLSTRQTRPRSVNITPSHSRVAKCH